MVITKQSLVIRLWRKNGLMQNKVCGSKQTYHRPTRKKVWIQMDKSTAGNKVSSLVVLILLSLLVSPALAKPTSGNILTSAPITSISGNAHHRFTREQGARQPALQMFPLVPGNGIQRLIQQLTLLLLQQLQPKGKQEVQRFKRQLLYPDQNPPGSLVSKQLIQPEMQLNKQLFKLQLPSQDTNPLGFLVSQELIQPDLKLYEQWFKRQLPFPDTNPLGYLVSQQLIQPDLQLYEQRFKRQLPSQDTNPQGSLVSQELIQPYQNQYEQHMHSSYQPMQQAQQIVSEYTPKQSQFVEEPNMMPMISPQQQQLNNMGFPHFLKHNPQDILNQQIADAATSSVTVPDPVYQAAQSAVMGATATAQLPYEMASTVTMPFESWVLSKPKWVLGSPRWKYETTFWKLEGPQWVLDPETNQWALAPAAWKLEEGTWKLDGQQWVLNGPAWSMDLSNLF